MAGSRMEKFLRIDGVVDGLLARVRELKKERRFKYIRPEEVEEYRRRGYEVKEGPKGGIRAYFPDVREGNADDLFARQVDDIDKFRSLAEELRSAVDDAGLDWLDMRLAKNFSIKAAKNLKFGHIDLGLSYAALLILRFPDKFGGFIAGLWGSEEEFKRWVDENIVRVKEPGLAGNFVGKYGLVELDSGVVTFKPIIRESLPEHVDTESLFNFVWFGIRDYLNGFNKSVESVRRALGIAFGDVGDVLDVFVSNVVAAAGVVESVLKQGPVDVSVSEDRIGRFRDFVAERKKYLVMFGFKDLDFMDNEFFSFEDLFSDVLGVARRFMGLYSAQLFVVSTAFMRMGYSKEEAASLAKGWLVARFWSDSDFVKYTHYVERLVTECRGNGRPVRKAVKLYGQEGLFFKKFVHCKDLENWRRFVREYLRSVYGDTVTVYRGIKGREVAQALLDFIVDGEVRLGGVAESGSVSERKAASFSYSGWVFKADIPVDYVIGCWLNAAGSFAEMEKEIIFEKPPGGLAGFVFNVKSNELNRLFSDEVYNNRGLLDDVLELLDYGLENIGALYGEDSEFFRVYNEKLQRAKEILGVGVQKGVGGSFSKERDYVYIRPDEVDEYRRRGYRIEEGPRGGIRAYFPGVGEGIDVDLGVSRGVVDDSEFVGATFDMANKARASGLDRISRSWVNLILRKARGRFGTFDMDAGLSFVAAAVLRFPDLFGEFVDVFWGSEDGFREWVEENVIRVRDSDAAGAIVGDGNIFEVRDGSLVTFKPLFEQAVVARLDSRDLFSYVWFGNERFVKDFIGRVDELRVAVDKAFDGGSDVLDGVVSKVVKMASVVEDILKQGPVEVDDSKIVAGIDRFESMVKARLRVLEYMYGEDWSAVRRGYFSFENLFGDLLDVAEEYMDKYSARLFVFATAFMKLGFSKEEAYSLAKGWEVTRFWTGDDFKTYTHYIERLIVKCKGNGRHVRRPYRKPNDYGLVFFSKFVSCEDLENWRKFVQAYLRGKYGDKIRVYRGVKAREVGQAVIDFIVDGEVRLGGVAESGTVDEEEVGSWGWDFWVFSTELPVDYVIGCWLNASRHHADKEREIMFEKPAGGLRGIMMNFGNEYLEGIFDDYIVSDPELQEAAIDIMMEGLESIKRTYGEDSAFYKAYRDKMLRAKGILIGNAIKNLVD